MIPTIDSSGNWVINGTPIGISAIIPCFNLSISVFIRKLFDKSITSKFPSSIALKWAITVSVI